MHGARASAWLRSRKVWLLVAIVVVLGSIAFYAAWIEPDWIEVTHHTVAANIGTPIKIAHLTDIHTSGLGPRESRMLEIIDAERLDLITSPATRSVSRLTIPGFETC